MVTSMVGVVLGSLLAVAAPDTGESEAPPVVLTGAAETGIYAGSQPDQDAVVFSPRLEIGVRARPEVELGFTAGAVSLTAQHQRDGRVRAQGPGNFVFGTRWVRDRVGKRHHGHLGFAFAFPTTLEPSAALQEAHRLARATRGGWNAWEWSPSTMGVLLPAGWSANLNRFEVGADGAVGGLFSASGDLIDPGFLGQVRVSAAARVWRVRVGGAVAGVYNGREQLGAFQASVQPFVALALCREPGPQCGAHLEASAAINVDAPYGFAPDGRRIWGTQVGFRWAIRDADSDR